MISKTGILMVLSEEAISTFQSYAQDDPGKTEAGGIILGKRRYNHFEIVLVTEPTEFDQRTRTHWVRSEKIHSDFAKKQWIESNRQITYLGEWHTHPERVPSPSTIDLHEWRKLGKECSYAGGLAMIIVGTENIWCGVVVKSEITEMDKVS